MPGQLQISEDGIKRLITTGEPDWFAQLRAEAFAYAQNGPLPHWDKRTRVTDFPWQWPPAARPQAVGDEPVAHVSPTALQSGVVISDLFTALNTHADLLQRYFASSVRPLEDTVTALHYAALTTGAFIYIPKNVQVAEPIVLKQRGYTSQRLHSNHVLIIAEAGSQAHLVESLLPDAGDGLFLNIVEVFALEGAFVQYACTQEGAHGCRHWAHRKATVESDAQVEWILASLGAKMSKDNTTTILKGVGSQVRNLAILMGTADQHHDVGIAIDHQGEHTHSDIMAKSVGADTARVIYRAGTHIGHTARYATAYQKGNTLLLDSTARGDAIPALTIDVDEVQASHAATIGQVDENQLFYLMSRGLTRQEAVRMVALGFVDPILQRLPSEELRTHLSKSIDRKMA
jgi:Fe-S cluster assembly protein SufD